MYFIKQHAKLSLNLIFVLCFGLGGTCYAAGGLNFYSEMGSALGVDGAFEFLFSSFITLLLTTLFGLYFRASINRDGGDVPGGARFSPRVAIESICDLVYSMSREQCGRYYLTCFPLLAGLFTFILITNVVGLIPGMPPATGHFSANIALGVVAFLAYNALGFREHGLSYVKQFLGPMVFLAPFFLVLELVSHAARPLSLAFRLTVNLFADHLVLGVFGGIVPFFLPVLFLCFGLLVACVQSFVFTMLTSIYVSIAISHDH